MPNLLRTAILIPLVVACSSTPQPVNTTPQPVAKPTIPDSVGAAIRTQTHTYPNAKMGVLYRYRAADFRPDVYVYDKADWGDVQSQASGFIATQEFYQQRGEYDAYKVLLTQPIKLDVNGALLEGHEVLVKYTNQDRFRDSYFAVVSLPTGEFVKFRITQPTDPNAIPKAREFVNAWIARYLPRRN